MITINLLPLKIRKTKVAVQLYTYLIVAGSTIALILLMLLIGLFIQLGRMDTQIRKAELQRAELAVKAGPLLDLDRQEIALQHSFALLEQLSRTQGEWIDLLDELANRVQDDLWLTKLVSRRSGNTAVLQLLLDGEAYQKIAVADFMQNLEHSEHFHNVTLESLVESSRANVDAPVQFKLRVEYGETRP